ncbi:hypothetical protein C1646_767773 [Rhizophagus diaphanus]|nr:hypothetical protein C1646_767773 [Rhizophagus diaphanus] [Rhizophagus sp. MUCL 43196]
MTLPYLTVDCIYSILQRLQNDRSTLFKCLLVNRFWCRSTIPLLYANPFENMIEKNYSITLTLFFCFNKAEILQLKKQLGLSQINNNINFDKEHNPLFEYLKYLENYNSKLINSVIYGWFAKYCSDLLSSLSSQKIYNNIIPIFHQLILRQRFNSKGEIEQEFLKNIANICTNCRKFIINFPQTFKSSPFQHHDTSNNLIDNTAIVEKLCTIIQVQNKLKMFKIGNCHFLLNNILLSLGFQKHSLVHVEFIGIDFSNVSLKRFNDLYNLEYLKFEYCKGILLNQCESLNFSSFKLKELSFKSNCWNIGVTSLMNKYLGASLKRLSIVSPNISLIENISMYCLNLIFLKIRIFLHIDLSVVECFKNLRTRALSISILYDNIFFEYLVNNISIGISEISIYIDSCDNVKFKKFLDNCHGSFEVINLNQIIGLELLKIVLNYIERSNNYLKVLSMKLDKELNDKELKLLNQRN